MENKKIKLAVLADRFSVNGISGTVVNYCCCIDKSQFDVSVITNEMIAEAFEKRLKDANVSVQLLASRKNETFKYYRELNRLMKSEKYDIIHINCNSATVTPELFLAKHNKIKVRIAHSHNITCSHQKANKMLMPYFKHLYTHGFACGVDAGKWLFGEKDFTVIPNAFDIEKFRYNEQIRKRVRDELKLQPNSYLIGHVGRFNNQKNHRFLLEVFEKVASKNENAHLLLIGNGPIFEEINELIKVHPYKERIIVYGESDRIYELYNAMDLFVLPSKFEGLGIVLLEAQMNGLYCLTSDKVPEVVKIGNNISFINLDDGSEKWSNLLLDKHDIDRAEFFEQCRNKTTKYDIKSCTKELENLYITFLENTK